MSYDARYDIPRSPHFPMESLSTCAEAARLTYEFVTSLFKASVTPSENSADLGELHSRRCAIDGIDADIRLKTLQVEILRRALRIAKDQLDELRVNRHLLLFETNAISCPNRHHLPPEILAKICYADYSNEIGNYEIDEISIISAPIEKEPWNEVHRTIVPVHIGVLPRPPTQLDEEQSLEVKVRQRCIRSAPAKLLIYIQARGEYSSAIDAALEFANRWHILVLDGLLSEPLTVFRLLQNCHLALTFLQKLIIKPAIHLDDPDPRDLILTFPPSFGTVTSRIRVAEIPFGYLPLTRTLFMHVTKLTISLHRAPSVDAYQVLHDSLSAIFSLRSLTMIISGWGQRTTSEAKIVLPNLEELAIETLKGHIIDDTEGFLMACGAFDCVSLKTFQAPICTCYREVGWGRPSEPNSWSNMESLANQVHFSYPRISELSLLSQNYTVGRFGWNEKTNDRGLSTFLWSLARPCTELEGEWLFPAMTHLTITLDYSHVSQALETLIILCRTRRNNGKTLPLRIIELHGVSGDAGDQDVIDQLSFLVHDVIVRY